MTNNNIKPTFEKVSTVIRVMPRRNKIKRSEYLKEGDVPVVDQSIHFIAGYIDDSSMAYDDLLPVIVFGDHTCVFKYIDFQFAVGADGTQLIRPKNEEKLDVRYLLYCLMNVPLEQHGYQRHFKYLKEAKIPIYPFDIQQKIAAALSIYDDLIETNLRQNEICARTRNLIMPKLLSGEIDISNLFELEGET